MKTSTTTIRLDTKLKKIIMDLAKQWNLSFTDMVNIALHEMARNGAHISATKYPPGFIEKLERDADETYRLYKEGKIKGYTSADELMSDMMKESEEYL